MIVITFRFFEIHPDFANSSLICDDESISTTLLSKSLEYNIIVNLYNGKVITATAENQVRVMDFTGNTTQYWYYMLGQKEIVSLVSS
jgi:hypothetical protein